MQVDELKQHAQQQQTAVEDRRRMESNSARDIKDVEAMLRGEAMLLGEVKWKW